MTRWLALGADYSVLNGNTSIVPKYLTPSLQTELGASLHATGAIGHDSRRATRSMFRIDGKTWTFAAGPQINFRQLKHITFFVRPDLGVIHEDGKSESERSDSEVGGRGAGAEWQQDRPT